MSGDKFLLDTNILLYITGKRADISSLPEGEFYVSFVSELEILSYPSLTNHEEKKLKLLLSEIPVIDLTQEIKDYTIRFRKQYRLKLPDALIAATACSIDGMLITNDRAFGSIKEINVKGIAVSSSEG